MCVCVCVCVCVRGRKRVKDNILKIFVDDGKWNEIGYDKATFLDDLIKTHFAKHEGEMMKTAAIDTMVQPGVLEDEHVIRP
jgi:hypothetical protein